MSAECVAWSDKGVVDLALIALIRELAGARGDEEDEEDEEEEEEEEGLLPGEKLADEAAAVDNEGIEEEEGRGGDNEGIE